MSRCALMRNAYGREFATFDQRDLEIMSFDETSDLRDLHQYSHNAPAVVAVSEVQKPRDHAGNHESIGPIQVTVKLEKLI